MGITESTSLRCPKPSRLCLGIQSDNALFISENRLVQILISNASKTSGMMCGCNIGGRRCSPMTTPIVRTTSTWSRIWSFFVNMLTRMHCMFPIIPLYIWVSH